MDTISTMTMGKDSTYLILYKKLRERKLLYTPYINVKINNTAYATWFLNQNDYDTIKTFKIEHLKATKSKIHLTGELEYIHEYAYFCNEIINIEKVAAGNYKNYNSKMKGMDYK